MYVHKISVVVIVILLLLYFFLSFFGFFSVFVLFAQKICDFHCCVCFCVYGGQAETASGWLVFVLFCLFFIQYIVGEPVHREPPSNLSTSDDFQQQFNHSQKFASALIFGSIYSIVGYGHKAN